MISIYPLKNHAHQDRFIFFTRGMAYSVENNTLTRVYCVKDMFPDVKSQLEAECLTLTQNRLLSVINQNREDPIPPAQVLKSSEKKQKLADWVCQKLGSAEFQTRQFAAEKIMDAIMKRSDSLDLSYLNLTELPDLLVTMNYLEKLHLGGNLLQKHSVELVSKMPGIKNLKCLKALIFEQHEVFSNPASFFQNVKAEDLKEPNRDWYKHRKDRMAERLAEVLPKEKFTKSLSVFEKAIGAVLVFSCLATLAISLSPFVLLVLVVAFAIGSLLGYAIGNLLFQIYNKLDSVMTNFWVAHGIGDGANPENVIKAGLKVCEALENTHPSSSLSAFKDALKDAYTDCFTQKGFRKIQNGELVILSAGYEGNDGGHQVCIVFYKNFMAICNRGLASDEAPLRIYEIDKNKITPIILENLRYLRFECPQNEDIGDEFMRYYINDALVQSLATRPVYIPQPIEVKPQKCGNCALASFKCAYFAATLLMQNQFNDDAVKAAKKQKRQFSELLRWHTLQEAKSCINKFYLKFRGKSDLIAHAEEKLKSYRYRKILQRERLAQEINLSD